MAEKCQGQIFKTLNKAMSETQRTRRNVAISSLLTAARRGVFSQFIRTIDRSIDPRISIPAALIFQSVTGKWRHHRRPYATDSSIYSTTNQKVSYKSVLAYDNDSQEILSKIVVMCQ